MIRERGFAGNIEIRAFKTSGDMVLDRSLEEIGGKGLFVRELDRALLEGEIDFAVHSLKDMPQELAEGTKIAAFSEREDPRDVLVLPPGAAEGDRSKPIGCSSKRRSLQLARLFPGWAIAPVRGNVLTRLEKLDRGEYGALVLAAAGLRRLGLAGRISRFFETPEMLPSAGQGIICAVTRAEDDFDFLAVASNAASAACAGAERAFVRALGGDCASPIGAFAETGADGLLTLRGLYREPGAGEGPPVEGSISGDPARAEELGAELAREILTQ
jgi:hydroxymethylbilane synthase